MTTKVVGGGGAQQTSDAAAGVIRSSAVDHETRESMLG
jgi:hypothetical protein